MFHVLSDLARGAGWLWPLNGTCPSLLSEAVFSHMNGICLGGRAGRGWPDFSHCPLAIARHCT